MKLGKAEILAIIESGLFVLGAIFFLIVFVAPSSPLWALVVGIVCALAGAGLWSYPLVLKLIKKRQAREQAKARAALPKELREDGDQTYELHRTETYETLTADAFSQASPLPPQPTSKAPTPPKTVPQPVPPTTNSVTTAPTPENTPIVAAPPTTPNPPIMPTATTTTTDTTNTTQYVPEVFVVDDNENSDF